MNQFKEDSLEKYKVNSRCFWTIEWKNMKNHIHLIIGVKKDYKEKDINDYCRIFGSYWKKYGINKFVDYDDSVGTYDKYIFKNFQEWDWFESEFGNYEKNVLFSGMESKNKMFSCDFDIIESVKKNKYSKTVKDSLLNYLDQEIKILKEREDLVLIFNGDKRKIKEKQKVKSKVHTRA